jgi:elongator complex protein 5
VDIKGPPIYHYFPSPELLISHMCTAVLWVSSHLHHIRKREAESQALPDPIEHESALDGIVSTLGSNSPEKIVVELVYRKKSGRKLREKSILNLSSGQVEPLEETAFSDESEAQAMLDFGTTFNIGLTQRQKETKDEVILPYFSAQRTIADEKEPIGGEIEYTLEAEDDFDDEEDVDEDLLI